MEARRLLNEATFGPEAMKAIGAAFDLAWRQIEGNFGADPRTVEKARHRLATAVLSLAREDSRDVDALARSALEAMARSYKTRAG